MVFRAGDKMDKIDQQLNGQIEKIKQSSDGIADVFDKVTEAQYFIF